MHKALTHSNLHYCTRRKR